MKIFKSLVMALAVVAAFSCSKNEPAADNGKRALSISIKTTQKSRAVDAPVAGGAKTDIESLYIYLTDGTTVLDRDIIADGTAVAEFVANGKIYSNIPSAVNEVLVVANKKVADDFPTAIGSSVADIKGFAFALASQQPDVTNQSAKYVTMMDAKGVLADGVTAEGVEKVKAEIVLAPIVGRLEINQVLKAGTGVHAIVVEKIWINNYFKSANYDAGNLLKNGFEIDDYAGNLQNTFGAGSEALNGILADKVDAYHLFSNNTDVVEMPNIVIKVSGTYDNGTGGQGAAFADKYITIKKYKDANGPVTKMKANNIYKVGLDKLTITASDLDSTPEAASVALEVSISVAEWTENILTPEI